MKSSRPAATFTASRTLVALALLGIGLAVSRQTVADADDLQGPIARWSFESPPSSVIAGRPRPAPGVVGAGLRFDGQDDCLGVPDAPALSFVDATFSVTVWVNVYALQRGQQMIIAKNVYSADKREWGLMVDDDDRFRFYLHSGRWRTVASRSRPTPGHWHHVAVTVDAGHGKVYVDGRMEGGAMLAPSVRDTDAPVTIGGVNDGGRLRQMFYGAIDEVALYDRALSAKDIRVMADRKTTPHDTPTPRKPFILWSGGPIPRSDDMPLLRGVEFYAIKPWEFALDGYRFLHGVALVWHKGRLYASFGRNQEGENTGCEQARGRFSDDGGKTWSPVFTIDAGADSLAVSHGVFLSHHGRLWAFHGAFTGIMRRVHTRAYRLDERTGQWQSLGAVAAHGFWPTQQPLRMDDGNWIMSGMRVAFGYDGLTGHLPAVAISHGDDLRRWDVVVVPVDPAVGTDTVWGESTVFLDGARLLIISRWRRPLALAATSEDYGRTWTPARPSNLPMAASKPYGGTLSTGDRYLIGTTTADSGNRRSPLTIILSRPGESTFSRAFIIRRAIFPSGPGESHRDARLAYPYAIEHEGKLYVAYSNSGGRSGKERAAWNNNSAELAVIPLGSLREAAP